MEYVKAAGKWCLIPSMGRLLCLAPLNPFLVSYSKGMKKVVGTLKIVI